MRKFFLAVTLCLSSHLHALQKIKVAVIEFFSPIPKLDAPQLIQAAAEGDIARIRQILGTKIPAHLEQAAHEAVCKAAQNGHAAIITELVGLGAPFTKKPLLIAAGWSKVEAFNELLRLGADVKVKDKRGKTALHYLVVPFLRLMLEEVPAETIITLVQAGANINAQDKSGQTPLDCAMFHNKTRAVLTLLHLGAQSKLTKKRFFEAFQATSELREVLKKYNEEAALKNKEQAAVIAEAFQAQVSVIKSEPISDIISAYIAAPLILEVQENQVAAEEEEKSTK